MIIGLHDTAWRSWEDDDDDDDDDDNGDRNRDFISVCRRANGLEAFAWIEWCVSLPSAARCPRFPTQCAILVSVNRVIITLLVILIIILAIRPRSQGGSGWKGTLMRGADDDLDSDREAESSGVR